MPSQFIGEPVEVTTAGEIKAPVSFRLGGREYHVAEVLDLWQDYGFGRSPLKRRRWWQRRHRTYYRVRTAEGEIYELYHDRGTRLEAARRGTWYLYRKL